MMTDLYPRAKPKDNVENNGDDDLFLLNKVANSERRWEGYPTDD